MINFIKDNKNGIIGTVLFHVMLLLIILFFGFAAPEPKFPDPEGILINFGTDNQGSGDIEPENKVNKIVNKQVSENKVVEENLTQDYQESAEVKKQHNNIKENKVNKKENKEVKPEVNKTALFPSNNNNNSNNEGETGDEGNQGRIDGSKDSKSHVGNGLGNDGIGYSLNGRAPIGKFPKPLYSGENKSGKVIIEIKVDKYGKVISAVKKEKGSTTSDPELVNAAIKAAWKARFNQDLNSIQQVGTITYNFDLD